MYEAIMNKILPIAIQNRLDLTKYQGILWFSLQLITNGLKRLENFLLKLHFLSWFSYIKFWNKTQRLQAIKNSNQLKQPQHISFILDDTDFDTKDVANLIVWSLELGSEFVTLHTYNELHSTQIEEIVTQCELNHTSSMDLHSAEIMCNKQAIKVNMNLFFSTIRSGKKAVSDTARAAAMLVKEGKLESENINYEWMDKSMQMYNSNCEMLPNPQLAIVFGEVQTLHGFQVWNTRLTEILHLKSLRNLSLNNYIKAIAMYSKCQQRFGK